MEELIHYTIFFKTLPNNSIIYNEIEAKSLSEAIEQINLEPYEVKWLKYFETEKSHEQVQFFHEAVKNYWCSNKFINVNLHNGRIIFKDNYGNSVDFDFQPTFIIKNGLKIFDKGLLFNDKLEIEIDSEFIFDDYKIIHYLCLLQNDYKKEFYKYGESLGISINDLQRLKMLAIGDKKYTEEDMQEYALFSIRCYLNKLPCIIANNWFEKIKNKQDNEK